MATQFEGNEEHYARATLEALKHELNMILSDPAAVVRGAKLGFVVDAYLRAAIAAHDQNSSAAAETLGIDRGTLHRKLTRKPRKPRKRKKK